MAELELNNIKASIESGFMDFEGYKKSILGEFQYEKKLLNLMKWIKNQSQMN